MNLPSESSSQAATLYIVDDEKSVRDSLRRLLQSCGYQTRAFSSGHEFLEQLPLEGIGCLILDLQMPRMNGIELQQKLKEAGCDIPIVS